MTTKPSELEISTLRHLAHRVAEVASLPVQEKKVDLWKAMNSLNPERPLVALYPERAWKELIPDETLLCGDTLYRTWERSLRRMIFQHEHIHDDRPIHGQILIPWVIDWGSIGVEKETIHVDGDGPEAIRWEPVINTMQDVEELQHRTISIDRKKTYERLDIAESIFDGIVPVRLYGGVPFWSVGVSQLTQLHGLQQTMIDMYEKPDVIHAIMAFLRDDKMQTMDRLEEEEVLSVNHLSPIEYFIGSGHEGYTDELPVEGFDGTARWKDMWGLGEMQEFSGVGPSQFEEFSLQYQLPLLERFGLVNYGCCEPLDQMYEMLMRNIPKLRRVSVTSPYADKQVATDAFGDQIIFAWKPNPTPLALTSVNWDWIEADMKETLQLAKGCCLEMVMKSTETFSSDIARLGKWVDTAYRCIDECA